MDFINDIIDSRYFNTLPSEEEQTEWEINYVDMVLHLLLRSNDIQSLLMTVIGEDFPKNQEEYRIARNNIWGMIEESQPDYGNLKLARPLAIKVNKDSVENPYHLLANWVTCGVLSYLLHDFDKVFEYALCVQETACQFDDDDILFAGGEYNFGLTMFCLRNQIMPVHKEISPEKNARYCQALLLDEKNHIYARSHGKEMRIRVAAFHELVAYLWQARFNPDGSRKSMLSVGQMKPIRQLANFIDRITRSKFQIVQWTATFY